MDKIGLCLPGGGFKGSVQVGAIQALLNYGKTPDMVTGTSVGALNGALIAMEKHDLLYSLWDEVGRTNGSIITKAYLAELKDGEVVANAAKIQEVALAGTNWKDKVGLITKKGRTKFVKKVVENGMAVDRVMDNSPLFDLLKTHVKESDFKVPFYFTIVSLYDGSLYTVKHDSFYSDYDLALAILASSTMPGVWAPIPKIRLKDGRYILDVVDGGLRASSPLPLLYQNITREDDWTIYSINPNTIAQMVNEKKKNLLTQAGASLNILLNEGLTRDVKMSQKINDWALAYPEWALKENIKYARLYNVEIPMDENGNSVLGKTLDPRPEWIEKRIALGYAEVEKYFKAA
jgi:NTE family protein